MSISWIWGGDKNKPQPQIPQNFNDFVPPAGAGDGGGDQGKGSSGGSGAMEAYRFDSSALERAAKAARELENNKNAKEIMEMIKQEAATKGEEARRDAEIMKGELDKQRARDHERLMQEKHKMDKNKADYQNQLARQRQQESLEIERKHKEDLLQREDAAQERRLQKERQEAEDRMKKQAAFDLNRAQQKAIAKGKVDRENQDLILEQIRVKAKEDRETRLESLKSFSNLFGAGFTAFFSDRQRVELAVGGSVALIAGVLFAKQALGLTFRQIEARMLKPSIVQETSRITLNDLFKHPIDSAKKFRAKFKPSEDALQGVVLKPEIEAAMRDIAIETKQCRQVNGVYRNVLLHGPPGTGKTLFARKLALNSGMDYALMTGGDIQLMGRKGVDAIHKLFAWALTSRKGLILFIDEAECFLLTRHGGLDQGLKETLAAFLNHTGEQNNKFMMVLTSNIPHELDEALLNRVHERIEFGLPGVQERTRLVAQYFEKFILDPVASGKWRIKLDECDWTAACKSVAEITEGLSGRELAQLASDWQMKTVASESGVLTADLMLERARVAVQRRKLSEQWKKMREENSFNYTDVMKQAAESKGMPRAPPVLPTS